MALKCYLFFAISQHQILLPLVHGLTSFIDYIWSTRSSGVEVGHLVDSHECSGIFMDRKAYVFVALGSRHFECLASKDNMKLPLATENWCLVPRVSSL